MDEKERILDKIHIRDLLLRCIIGLNEEERRDRQDVIINITLHLDLRAACRSDRIGDSVNYRTVKKSIIAAVERSSFNLVEHLAETIAGKCLEFPEVERVDVAVDKPGALRFARSVAVEIVRLRGSHG